VKQHTVISKLAPKFFLYPLHKPEEFKNNNHS
jgi:hypothetical protein